MNQASQHSPRSSKSHIPVLDGIRGFGLLTVLFFHTLQFDHQSSVFANAWNSVAKSCWVGVDLFFVLSGYLITGVLYKTKGESGSISNFYLRRALRILPLYFATLFTAIYLVPLLVAPQYLPSVYPRVFQNQIWAWTFLQNVLQARSPHQLPGLGHLWTLGVEEQFYLIWPAVVLWLSRRNLILIAAAICTFEPLARFLALNFGYSTWAVRQITYLRLDAPLYGALLYALANARTERVLPLDKLTKWIFAPILFAIASLIVIWCRYSCLPYQSPEVEVIGYSAIEILAAALLYACLRNSLVLTSFFSLPILRWFGKYSYGIYVFSIPAIYCFEVAIQNQITNVFLMALARFLFVGLLSSSLALLSWRFLESPFLRLKSKLQSSRPSVFTASSAAS